MAHVHAVKTKMKRSNSDHSNVYTHSMKFQTTRLSNGCSSRSSCSSTLRLFTFFSHLSKELRHLSSSPLPQTPLPAPLSAPALPPSPSAPSPPRHQISDQSPLPPLSYQSPPFLSILYNVPHPCSIFPQYIVMT